jgi:hypothetical protein
VRFVVTADESAPIVSAANSIVDEINNLSLGVTAERVYVHRTRFERITDTTVWVQPVEEEITNESRKYDTNTYTIDVGIFARCADDSEVDTVMSLAHDIYCGLRRVQYSEGSTLIVEKPTLFSPDFLDEKNLFGALMSVQIVNRTS